MAKCKCIGLEEYEGKLLQLKNLTTEMIGRAVFDGAAVVADRVKANIGSIPIDNRFVRGDETLNGISELQKQGLEQGFGIAPMRDEGGYMHVKLGFNGYNAVRSKKYPAGQPNSVIARSVNSGTSFRQRIPFVDDAVNASKAQAEEAMKKTFDEELGKVMN